MNRIKALRTQRGWSMERLAEAIGAGTSTVNRLEKGETELVSEWVPKIAAAFGVTPAELLGWTEPAGPGLSDTVTPFVPDAAHPLATAKWQDNQVMWTAKSASLDAIGIAAGDVVIVDISQRAVDAVQSGDAVVVQVVDGDNPMRATTHLRQYIEPDLFITNSRANNEPPFNRREQDVRIKGVITNRFAAVRPARH